MQKFEYILTLSGKQARAYDFSTLVNERPIYADKNTPSLQNNPSPQSTNKPVLHFYGGNGFPVGVYEPLIRSLSQYFEVHSLAMRGYWPDLPSDKVLTREQDADVLIEFLDKTQDKPIIGIGHSQGATATAMAAAKRPDLFTAVYLIDPVTFTKAQQLLYSNIPKSILMTQQPFKSTQTKQTEWDSIQDYYQSLRQQFAFKRISDDNLYLFAKNSLVKQPDGRLSLLFKPQYELASYFGTPYVTPALKKLNKSKLPYYLILAKPSIFNSQKVRDSWDNIVPRQRIKTFKEYGHLIPMEAPQRCVQAIIEFENQRL